MADSQRLPWANDTSIDWNKPTIHRIGRHLFVHQRQIDLHSIAKSASDARYFYIYCDTLVASTTVGELKDRVICEIPNHVRELHVRARCFLPDASTRPATTSDGIRAVYLTVPRPEFHMTLISDDAPAVLCLTNDQGLTTVVLSQGVTVEKLPSTVIAKGQTIPVGSAIITLSYSTNLAKLVDDMPEKELEFTMGDILEASPLHHPRFMGRLLELIFCEAAAVVNKSVKIDYCISAFRFIIQCTRKCPSFAELNLQSETMLARVNYAKSGLQWVPNQKHTHCSTNLSNLINESGFTSNEAAAESILVNVESGVAEIQSQIGKVGGTIIEQLGYSHTNYKLDLAEAQENIHKSKQTLTARNRDFNAMTENMTAKRATFQAAMDDWVKNKQKEIDQAQKRSIFDAIFAIFEVVIAIGSAFATGGATAGSAAETTVKAVEKVSKITQMVNKLKALVKKIEEIKAKFEEVMKTINVLSQGFEAIKSQFAERKDAKYEFMAGDVVPAVTGSVDYVGLSLTWSDYRIDMENMFDIMKIDCEGLDNTALTEYRVTVLKLVTYAGAVIDNQKELSMYEARVLRSESDNIRLEARKQEVTEISARMQSGSLTKAQVLERQKNALKVVVASEAASLKRWLFVEMHSFAAACAYHTASRAAMSTIDFSATKKLSAYQSDFKKLEKYANENKQSTQQRKTTLSMKDLNLSASDGLWRLALEQTQALTFQITSSSPKLRNWLNATVRGCKVMMKGLGIKPDQENSEDIVFAVIFGPRMKINNKTEAISIYSERVVFEQESSLKPLSNGSKLLEIADEETGIYEPDTTKISPSMFGSMEIRLAPSYKDVIDFANVTDISILLSCNVDIKSEF